MHKALNKVRCVLGQPALNIGQLYYLIGTTVIFQRDPDMIRGQYEPK